VRELVAEAHLRLRAAEDRLRALVWRGSAPLRRIDAIEALLTWLANSTKRPRPSIVAPAKPRPVPLDELTSLTMPTSQAPAVSIIIPVFNQLTFTYACLDSIVRNTDEPSYEVIVVDDASSDGTPAFLARVDGARVVRNERQLGFIGACNAGAAVARGEHLVFLNNDTEVREGWLRELHDTFRREPRAGIVGAKLISPDGRLQEAGGIVWRDGAAWNAGRLGAPDDPRWSYLRRVDYCSGACLMIPRALFASLDGFDAHYAPAYFEDVDLAFRVRRAGYEVWYQPLAEVLHVEGQTHGRDTSTGIKRYQLTNAHKFAARFGHTLTTHGLAGVAPDREQDRDVRGRVLVVDALTPQPDRDAGSLRMFNLMQLMRELGFKVTFMPANLARDGEYTRALQRRGIEVLHHPFVASVQRHLKLHVDTYDLVILSRAAVAAQLMRVARRAAKQARIVFDTVDLHHLRELREAMLKRDPELMRKAAERRHDELGYMALADCTLVVSAYEQQLLAATAPNVRVRRVSLIHDVPGVTAPFCARDGILFVGGFRHPPNVDAAVWLVSEIWPRLRARLPGVTLHLVGAEPPDAVRKLAAADVVVTGFVPDLALWLRRCRLSVAPLRFGAGVKGKIVSSLSHGVPVVATTLAVEGMHITAGNEALVTDDADAFATAIARLYTDEPLWQQLSRAGVEHVARHFSFAAGRAALASLLAELVPGANAESAPQSTAR
jgi:GT2 family glycosyltransferase